MTLPRKELFHLPEGVIYLDGNSLGPLPKSVTERTAKAITEEWGDQLIRAWNTAGWMDQPRRVGNLITPLVGAPENSITMGDTLSIKVYQALAAGLKMRPDRKVILSDTGNFPTDLYMAEGLIKLIDGDIELKVVPPEQVEDYLDDSVAVMMLTQVDYRTGRLHDMASLTRKAHQAGAVVLWDLAHSAGALPIDLEGSKAEFAVGCTYKYLNAGPGSPAFIYTRPDLADTAEPALSGWMGHASPFAFELDYQPSPGIERMRVGTPPVLQLAALDAALDVWEGVSMHEVRAKSIELSELFIREVENRCLDLKLVSPRESENRGSQVSFAFDDGYAAMQALIAAGVIGDFRAPDVMRFGFTPLYIDSEDVMKAVAILEDIMANRAWDRPEFKQRAAVT